MSRLMTFVGIDNGVTGSVGVVTETNGSPLSAFFDTPVVKCMSYTKEKQFIHRIDHKKLCEYLKIHDPDITEVYIERPMVNPRAFKATQSALRALEATIIVMELMGFEYFYIDSKEWQREFFASNIIGHDDMKDASAREGMRLFPNNESFITKHGDADGLLIAEWARRKFYGRRSR